MADKQATQQVPSVGRIVHYVLSNGFHRPAIIVHVYDSPSSRAHSLSPVDLRVFLGKYDSVSISGEQPSEVKQGTTSGTWHWPEYVPPLNTEGYMIPPDIKAGE